MMVISTLDKQSHEDRMVQVMKQRREQERPPALWGLRASRKQSLSIS